VPRVFDSADDQGISIYPSQDAGCLGGTTSRHPFGDFYARRVKLLSLTAISQADGACGSSAVGPFRRLTDPLPGPKLCVSPQPHRGRHELRPPALATPARYPGSERPPGQRIAPSLHARGVGRQGCMAKPAAIPGTGSVCAWQEKTPPILPFTTQMESDQRLRVCRRDAPSVDERFCRRIRPSDNVFGTHRCGTLSGGISSLRRRSNTCSQRCRLFATAVAVESRLRSSAALCFSGP
jgi:hypothetical protein